jgi:hypothetical protein
VTRAQHRAAGLSRIRSLQRPNLVLEIDELIIAGWPKAAGYAIADAFHHELTRLIGERGLPAALRQNAGSPSLDAGAVHVGRGARAAVTGAQIATSVYGVRPR